ncbi:class I SAM-dependent methyltransferase [Promicromonospora sp. Populi]|uniref:class I SAM-dependent methyltransferase n=1 Tax=Promicromonospora sp. Populi TaxID=3239420 RepID=UPI0034E1F5C9
MSDDAEWLVELGAAPSPAQFLYRDVIARQRAAYSSFARGYEVDAERRETWAGRWLQPAMRHIDLGGRKKSAVRVLDVGSGIGTFAGHLAREGFDVWAIDIADEMVKRTRARLRGVYGSDAQRRAVRGSFMEHDFASQRFDLILGVAFVHCLPKPVDVLAMRKMARLLTPDGIAYLTTTDEPDGGEALALKDAMRGERDGTLMRRYRTRYTPTQFIERIRASGLTPWSWPRQGAPVELDRSTPSNNMPIFQDTHVRRKRWVDVVATRSGVPLPMPTVYAGAAEPARSHEKPPTAPLAVVG